MSLYLLAILTPEETDVQVNEWKTFMLDQYGCRVAMKSPAHITLIPPFRLGDERIENLRGLLEQFVSAYRVFDVELKNFSAFAPKVIYVDVISNSTLEALKNRLEDALLKEHYPVKKEERKFHPHVTIANRDLKKEDFPRAWDYFKGIRFNKQFPVQAISLLKHNGQRWITWFNAALP